MKREKENTHIILCVHLRFATVLLPPAGHKLSHGHPAWQRAHGLLCYWLKTWWNQLFYKHCRQQTSPVWTGFHSKALNCFPFRGCYSVSRGFRTICKALNTVTGEQVSVAHLADSAALKCFHLCWQLWLELCIAGRTLLQGQKKRRPVSACKHVLHTFCPS